MCTREATERPIYLRPRITAQFVHWRVLTALQKRPHSPGDPEASPERQETTRPAAKAGLLPLSLPQQCDKMAPWPRQQLLL